MKITQGKKKNKTNLKVIINKTTLVKKKTTLLKIKDRTKKRILLVPVQMIKM